MRILPYRFGTAGSAIQYSVESTQAARAIGFHWETDDQYRDALRREVEEAAAEAQRQPFNADAFGAEVGDVLLSAVAWAQRLGRDPEAELRGATDRFNQRVAKMQAIAPKPIADMDLAEKWHWFKEAKKALATP